MEFPKTATVTLLPPVPVLSNLTCTPASFTAPGNSTCTVSLSGNAPKRHERRGIEQQRSGDGFLAGDDQRRLFDHQLYGFSPHPR